MAQSSITNNFLASGIAGEFSRSINQDSFGAILNSTTEASNVAGRVVFTVEDNDEEVGVAADGNFAGIITNPKAGVRQTLATQEYVSNATQIDIATRGYMWVTVAAAAAKGDFVYFTASTGVISTEAPADVPAGTLTRLPGGIVKTTVTAAGLCEIEFDITGSTETPTA